MQLLLLGLVAALFVYDDVLAVDVTRQLDAETVSWTLLSVLGAKLGVVAGFAWLCRRTHLRLGQPDGKRWFHRLERALTALPFVWLTLFIGDLAAGWLPVVRAPLGNLVVVDEALALLPTLAALLAVWWLYYPIDRRLREATIFRRADQGLPLYPVWTRGAYVATQFRNQVLILLAPLLVVMAWGEALQVLVYRDILTLTAALWLTPIGAGVLFLFAPTLLRHVFDTVPLPAGSVREHLAEVCGKHRVGVRDLLLWRTGGNLINAAVMGLVAPLRYVLLTDGLLDQLHRPHVEAVMAHELGHVRHRHLVWLVLAAAATMAACFGAADLVLMQTGGGTVNETIAAVLAMAAWAAGFGWVSRRVERQADTFAAKHMSVFAVEAVATGPEAEAPPEPETAGRLDHPQRFTAAGVLHVVEALQRVADLNATSATRRSWRHGSIAARQRYLRGLPGKPLNRAGVDRVMAGVKLATLAVLVGLGALAALT